MTNGTGNQLEQLTNFIDPQKGPQDSVSVNEETPKEILKEIAKDRNLSEGQIRNIIDEYTNLINNLRGGTGDIKTIINNILRQLGCSEITDEDIRGIGRGLDFPKIASALKQLSRILSDKCRNRESNKRRFGQIKFLFDTCYNEVKAERLKKALEKLESRLGSDLFKKFLVLFAAVLARSAKDYDYFLRSEWFLLLVRAAAGAIDDRGKFIPVCSTKGDVAIIIVYIIVEGKVFSGSITKDDVKNIVSQLAKLT